MQINIKNEKDILRSEILNRRNEINDIEKESKNLNIFNRLMQLNEIKYARNICTYVSKKGEADTITIIKKLISMSKAVYVPKSDIKSSHMSFYRISSLSELILGAFSVLEPVSTAEEYVDYSKSDVCIVPGLCFDKEGFRLGYGKGYYDRFLKNFQGVKIGICFEEFISEALPKYETDMAVDIIISENRKILCKGESKNGRKRKEP